MTSVTQKGRPLGRNGSSWSGTERSSNLAKVIDAFRQAAMNNRLLDRVDDLIQRFHLFGDRVRCVRCCIQSEWLDDMTHVSWVTIISGIHRETLFQSETRSLNMDYTPGGKIIPDAQDYLAKEREYRHCDRRCHRPTLCASAFLVV